MNPIIYFALLFASANGPQPASDCKSHFDTSVNMNVYTTVDITPEYPGGAAAWGRFVNRNFREENVGTVTNCNVKFKMIVTAEGEIVKVVALHGDTEVKEPNELEKEVVRMVRKSGRWTPGVCEGKQVATEFVQTLSPCNR